MTDRSRDATEGLRRDYRAAFLRYLPRREESALHSGYQLGRAAVVDRLSMLDLARAHHDILLELLRETPADEHVEVASAASDFFLEVLATYDMTQRTFGDAGARRSRDPEIGGEA